MSHEGFYIAIDGGGTKTEGMAFTGQGRVLGVETRGPSNRDRTGLGVVVDLVADLVDDLALPIDRPLLGVGTYLSGLDFPRQVALFRESLLSRPLASGRWPRLTVENDILAVLRTGTDAGSAVAVVCGTGINAIGVRADGARVRYPAAGDLSGDWGGGLQLGREALWHAARDEDGRGRATSLTAGIKQAFGVADILELIMQLDSEELPLTSLATLSPTVMIHAHAGDRVALGLVHRLGDEIALLATTTLRRLDLLDETVPVVLGGGVMTAGDDLLLDRVAQAVSAEAPHAAIRLIDSPPIVGAALLSLDDSGRTVSDSLRAHLAEYHPVRRKS